MAGPVGFSLVRFSLTSSGSVAISLVRFGSVSCSSIRYDSAGSVSSKPVLLVAENAGRRAKEQRKQRLTSRRRQRWLEAVRARSGPVGRREEAAAALARSPLAATATRVKAAADDGEGEAAAGDGDVRR